MLWHIDEPDPMPCIRQKGSARRHRFQDSFFALNAQFVSDFACLRDITHQRLRDMRRQIVHDEDPAASGSLATVRAMCWPKSSSVRVNCTVGKITSPVA